MPLFLGITITLVPNGIKTLKETKNPYSFWWTTTKARSQKKHSGKPYKLTPFEVQLKSSEASVKGWCEPENYQLGMIALKPFQRHN
jgi:hypothetical protein